MREGRACGTASDRGGSTPFNVLPARSVGNGTGHGASTPETVVGWWLRYICPPNGVVLDTFAGSGTVALAAEKQAKASINVERMPKYFDVACRRLEDALKSEPLLEGVA
jgi:site-specific DNA-methyltransferase (adenine-specific)